jgi:transposase InsO family protein
MRSLLTKIEVAGLLGRSVRWVERNDADFVTEASYELARNGRAQLLYRVDSLPMDAQRKWVEKQKSKVVEILPAETDTDQMVLALETEDGPNLGATEWAEAERRWVVIEPLVSPDQHQGIWAHCGGRKTAAVAFLAEQHGVKGRTIYHWLKAFQEGGLPALVSRDRRDKGRPRAFNPAALDFILAASLPRQGVYGALSVREIHRVYEEERAWRASHAGKTLGEFELRKYARYLDRDGKLRPDAQLPAASYETFRVWFNKIPDVVKVMARKGEEAYSNTQEIISFRNLSEVQPMDYLVMDHRVLDLFCLVKDHGGWKLARPWLTAAIDMRTRKWVAWAIVETPSSDSIASVLKRAFIRFGLWKAVLWDNGKDFRCEWLEGKRTRAGNGFRIERLADGVRGVMETLGVRVHHAIVKRARSKIIEPNFVNTANFDRTLPTWCGHRPSARPERLGALIDQHEAWLNGKRPESPFQTIDGIAALYEEFIGTLNEREHTGEGMRKVTPTGRGWMCPNECWEKLIPRVQVRTAPAEVIQFCFQKRRKAKVRNGELRPSFHGRQFHYRLIENPLKLMALNGRDVEFAYDPHDLETAAIYYDGRFVGLANNVELRRMGEESFVADERDRRRARREVKRFVKAVHGAVHVPDAVERAVRRQAVRPAGLIPAAAANETPADLPADIVQASEAAQQERSFQFEDSPPIDIVMAEDEARGEGSGEDEFHFFAQEA